MKISLRSLWQLPSSGGRAFCCSGCWCGVVLWNAMIGLDGVFYKVPSGLRHRSQERALGSVIPKPRLVTYTWLVNMHFVLLAFTSCPAPLVVTHEAVLLFTWVISKVLPTVPFLFKNEFILQNTFTGLQCNLHCALSQRSNVWESLVFLSGRLRCRWVWLLGSPH